jgi:hypothetical protein
MISDIYYQVKSSSGDKVKILIDSTGEACSCAPTPCLEAPSVSISMQ